VQFIARFAKRWRNFFAAGLLALLPKLLAWVGEQWAGNRVANALDSMIATTHLAIVKGAWLWMALHPIQGVIYFTCFLFTLFSIETKIHESRSRSSDHPKDGDPLAIQDDPQSDEPSEEVSFDEVASLAPTEKGWKVRNGSHPVDIEISRHETVGILGLIAGLNNARSRTPLTGCSLTIVDCNEYDPINGWFRDNRIFKPITLVSNAHVHAGRESSPHWLAQIRQDGIGSGGQAALGQYPWPDPAINRMLWKIRLAVSYADTLGEHYEIDLYVFWDKEHTNVHPEVDVVPDKFLARLHSVAQMGQPPRLTLLLVNLDFYRAGREDLHNPIILRPAFRNDYDKPVAVRAVRWESKFDQPHNFLCQNGLRVRRSDQYFPTHWPGTDRLVVYPNEVFQAGVTTWQAVAETLKKMRDDQTLGTITMVVEGKEASFSF
jgi:hypothetical protein